MYCVYVHHFPNGKKYVGVTSWKPELRWGANGRNYKNPYMTNAIKKYGWNNIKHEIVAQNLTTEQASEMEIKLIRKYNSANRKYGYNISLGGIDRKICSEETKEKLREKLKGKKLSDYVLQKANEAKFHKVRNIHTGEIYPSIKNACEKTGLNRSTIIRQCTGVTKKKDWEYADN